MERNGKAHVNISILDRRRTRHFLVARSLPPLTPFRAVSSPGRAPPPAIATVPDPPAQRHNAWGRPRRWNLRRALRKSLYCQWFYAWPHDRVYVFACVSISSLVPDPREAPATLPAPPLWGPAQAAVCSDLGNIWNAPETYATQASQITTATSHQVPGTRFRTFCRAIQSTYSSSWQIKRLRNYDNAAAVIEPSYKATHVGVVAQQSQTPKSRSPAGCFRGFYMNIFFRSAYFLLFEMVIFSNTNFAVIFSERSEPVPGMRKSS